MTANLKVSSLRGLTQTGEPDLTAPAGENTRFFQQKIDNTAPTLQQAETFPKASLPKIFNLNAVTIKR
jgi:hypothetical protein